MRYMLGVLSLFLIFGCSSKQPDVQAEEEKVLNFGMTQSKKIEMIDTTTQAKTFITITYLQPLKHPLIDQNKEQFIVGVYHMDGVSEAFKTPLKNFSINAIPKESIHVTSLKSDSPLLELVSSSNPWTQYLLVEAPKVDQIDMTIEFESGRSQKVSAKFRKDY